MTAALIAAYLVLQAAVIVLRYTLFRIEGPAPAGVRLIEVATLACMGTGVVLLATRSQHVVMLDQLALAMSAVAGALLAWTCHTVRPQQLSAAFSPDLPTELIQDGPYRVVRNPFYLAYLIGHLVPLLATQSPWAASAWAVMALIYRHAAILEERKFLTSPLADAYRRYIWRTGRFVPRCGLRWGRYARDGE